MFVSTIFDYFQINYQQRNVLLPPFEKKNIGDDILRQAYISERTMSLSMLKFSSLIESSLVLLERTTSSGACCLVHV